MWSISNLKNRGKEAFKRNYWKCVLIGLLVSLLAGGASGSFSGATSGIRSSITEDFEAGGDKAEDKIEEYFDDEFRYDDTQYSSDYHSDFDFDEIFDAGDAAVVGALFAVIMIFVVIIVIIAILMDLFVNLPLEVGTCRFFFKNQKTEAKVAEVVFAYDNCWKNIAVTMFLRDLFTFFWSLLFIIPGIIKAYEYRMIPYILAENPDMDRKDVFALSKKMMDGEKWHAFVLDLSFIGWHILSLFTAGILEVFYVVPYQASTNATLYEALKYLKIDHPYKRASEPVNPVPEQSEQTNL